MAKFFINRLIRRKSLWISLIAGCLVSTLYFFVDVYRLDLYKSSVYTMWIESFSSSDVQTLFFTVIPTLAAIAMADLYLSDKNSGYLNVILSKGKNTSYFGWLYFLNFCVSGLTMLLPLIWNLYLCFQVCPNRAPDLLVEGTNIVNYFGKDTLFPSLYYNHPLAHVCIYLVLGFVAAGIFGSLALSLSFFVKNKFLVWIGPYVINYVYISLKMAMSTGRSHSLLSVCVQHGEPVTVPLVISVIVIWLAIISAFYWMGVRKRVEL